MLKKFLRLIIIIMIIGFAFIYTKYIERSLLTTKNYDVSVENEDGTELKVVQFSDTHLGDYFNLTQLEKVVERINNENPDIVVFTGDLMDNASNYAEINSISKVLSKIKATYGKYAVYGNRDYGGGASRYYSNIMDESGFKLLINSSDVIKIENKNIRILGADDALLGTYDSKKTVRDITSDMYNLLILHEPDLIDNFIDYPINLALAGHSHGGQVYIPFYGPAIKTDLAEKYTKDFYTLDNEIKTQLYVNSGIGNTKVPYRIFNIPQISVFRIKI